jgi:ribonucleotide reductase beta subunit family protein with ferritin-like domain
MIAPPSGHLTKPLADPVVTTDRRYTLFPIQAGDIWHLYSQQLQKIWTHDEVDFSQDRRSWETMSEDEQHFLSMTLAFFANSDNIVIDNISSRFAREITLPEARLFLGLQAAIEGIHVVTYNLSIDAVIADQAAKESLFNAINTSPIIQPKTAWALKWSDSTLTLSHRLVAFAAVEGIFFASSFASIFWLRKQQKVPGICFANEKIVEDESLHVRFVTTLYRGYYNDLDAAVVRRIIADAVAVEHEFVDSVLPVNLIGMNAGLMKQYVCTVADVVLQLLGVEPLYNMANPFKWMVGIGLMGKSNFFEKKVAEYGKASCEDAIRTFVLPSLPHVTV